MAISVDPDQTAQVLEIFGHLPYIHKLQTKEKQNNQPNNLSQEGDHSAGNDPLKHNNKLTKKTEQRKKAQSEQSQGHTKQTTPGPKVIKLFSCSTQLAFSYLLAEKISCSVMFSKTEFEIVSNLRFISRTNVMLNWIEHEKSFITTGPEPPP